MLTRCSSRGGSRCRAGALGRDRCVDQVQQQGRIEVLTRCCSMSGSMCRSGASGEAVSDGSNVGGLHDHS